MCMFSIPLLFNPGLKPPTRSFVPQGSKTSLDKLPKHQNHFFFKLSSFDKLRILIVKLITPNHSIPEAPNRQPISLIGAAPACTAKAVVQVAVPSVACTVLRRTPPVTVGANGVVMSTFEAVTAR